MGSIKNPAGKIVPGTYHHFEGTIGTSMQHSKLYCLSGNGYFSFNVAWNPDATFLLHEINNQDGILR